MVLALEDKWVWDTWYIHDGTRWHCYFLQADKSIGDPELRHWNVSYGHATSQDLINWTHLGTCFEPASEPAWDDYTIWTGSVVRDGDGLWHLFYTGTSKADNGKGQRIGHATSQDLHNWTRVGSGLILDRDERYEEYQKGRWHDRAFRDPWVMRDPKGDGWIMYFTGRDATVEESLEAGAIGFATSSDLYNWTLQDPVFTGGFGELEVPQVFESGGHWYCLFCTSAKFWASQTADIIGTPMTGTHYLIGETERGPWKIAPGPLLDNQRYAARILETEQGSKLLGFLSTDEATGEFAGIIPDPVTVKFKDDGRLALASNI